MFLQLCPFDSDIAKVVVQYTTFSMKEKVNWNNCIEPVFTEVNEWKIIATKEETSIPYKSNMEHSKCCTWIGVLATFLNESKSESISAWDTAFLDALSLNIKKNLGSNEQEK